MDRKTFLRKLGKALWEDGCGCGYIDTDHPTCPECGSTMDFYGHSGSADFPIGEGYWKCDNCGFVVTEEEVSPYIRD